ncbi:MAG: helix-turn-helix domain-containing protein, partial [Clostridia bacterium]|nr:helix-turn-helix domain-containing protein [Clostridia bacterium]
MTLETANRLYELRKKHNLSQEELAEKLGVSRQAVSKWERSEASPDTDNLIALAKIYDLSLDELIYGEKEEKEKSEEEIKENTSSKSDESVYIDIDDGEDKVKIGPEGILVEEKNGNTVKININGKIMEKVIKKIEDKIDEPDDEDDDYYDDDELNE